MKSKIIKDTYFSVCSACDTLTKHQMPKPVSYIVDTEVHNQSLSLSCFFVYLYVLLPQGNEKEAKELFTKMSSITANRYIS